MSAKGLSSRAIIGRFYQRLEQNPGLEWVAALSNYFTSDQESETYKWLGQVPVMREWIGGRQAKGFRENGITIENKHFEATLEVLVRELRRDKARMYLGFINEDFTTLIADPFLIFDGRMDTAEIADGGDTATITLTAESRLRDLERVRTRRYTDADQQSRFPGDKGLEYVPSLQDKQIVWGRAPE